MDEPVAETSTVAGAGAGKFVCTGTATHHSFPLFDWLRFALASIVALTHEHVIGWDRAANFAVQVFFALSGWLIGGILLRTEFRRLPRFYYNRATRIWIPYFVAAAVLYGLAAGRDGIDVTWLRCLLFDGTFTHNWFINPLAPMPLDGTGSHFWSISVEEQFYLAAPLLLFLPRVGRSILFWILVALLAVNSWYAAISLGVLCAVIRRRAGDWQTTPAGVSFCAGAALAFGVALIVFPSDYPLLAPPLACLVVLLASWTGQRDKSGELIGAISYPLYLYHWIGAFVGHALVRHFSVPFGLIAYPVAVVAGAAAYFIVDRNVMRWRSPNFRPAYGKAVTATAYALLAAGVTAGLTMR